MLKNKLTGLSDSQVIENRRKYGANVLTPPKRRSLFLQFWDKLKDPLIIILLVALLLSTLLSIYEYFFTGSGFDVLIEPLGIFIAIALATLIGFFVEVNANKKFEMLNTFNDDTQVKVLRNGNVTQIPRRDVVVGDTVILEAGEKIPADGELIDSVSMSVNESSFTGEPLVHKFHQPELFEKEATYPSNKLLRGSTIVDGHGTMTVMKVGDATEYGKIYTDAQIDNQQKTPLMKQFDQLGKVISRISYIIGALIIVGRLLVFWLDDTPNTAIGGIQYFIETIMIAVTLIVVSVPEGLPMSVTLSLALSMRRMLLTNNLVRKMHACETMGAATIICTDKTGTLTKNQMQVHKAHFFNLDNGNALKDDDASMIVEANIACNSTAYLDCSVADKIKAIGNPTEGALLLWLKDAGIDYNNLRDNNEIIDQIPFSTERKYMATIVKCNAIGHRLLLVKGASEIILKNCVEIAGGIKQEDVMAELLSYQNKAMRTLGFAYKVLDDDEPIPFDNYRLSTDKLTFMGVVAISDPIREDAPDAIRRCLDAGIRVKIITGDTPGTAKEIGRQVGLWNDDDDNETLISGTEFASLSDEEAAKRAEKIKIMSRARPDDKARMVKLLQEQGEVVAVTGDGTNDAPALNAAQVGLSMGDGTSVAKEASDITILDNSFASINKAVLWGRSLYKNIQRFILFQLTVNLVACLLVGICSFFSEQPALTVTQMLWVNLIMDTLAALALASLPPNEEVMHEKPRKNGEPIITKHMMNTIITVGSAFTIIMLSFFIYLVEIHRGSGPSFFAPGISVSEVSLYFTTFVFLQFWNLFNAKAFESGHTAFHDLKNSKIFLFIIAAIFAGQILIVQFGGKMFNVEPMTLSQWGKIFALTSLVLIIGLCLQYYGIIKKKRGIENPQVSN
jgi:Ca2+-transporting ATPase